jgi:multimeric flavodoxin WrbA
MNVLGLVGSPRKQSNTDLLITAILEGAQANAHVTEKIYLYDQDIHACLDCRACKQGKHQCILKDDLTTLYRQLEEADVIIFGTPLYWYGPSAKMKLLVDRLRPYIASKLLAGKAAVLVVPSEEGADACNLTVDMFRWSFKYLEINLAAVLLPKVYERAEIKAHPEALNEAFLLGKNLSQELRLSSWAHGNESLCRR